MQLKNKKGVGLGFINLIIALFVLIIIIAISAKIYDIYVHDSKESLCRSSITAMSEMRTKGVQLSLDELQCPVEVKEVDPNKIAKAKYDIAEEMRSCWDMYGEGKNPLFSESGRTYCSVCSIVEFDKKAKPLTNFEKFLDETPMLNDKDGITYGTYLRNHQSKDASSLVRDFQGIQAQGGSASDLDTSKDYSIIVVYAKGITNARKILNAGTFATRITGMPLFFVASGASATYEYFAGESEDAYLAMIVLKEHDKDTFKDLGCEIYPNVQRDYVSADDGTSSIN